MSFNKQERISADQARKIRDGALILQKEIADAKIQSELNEYFSAIEKAANDGESSVTFTQISEEAKVILLDYGYSLFTEYAAFVEIHWE